MLISTAFFVLFVFTALTSAIALVEVVAANLIDLLGWSRKKSRYPHRDCKLYFWDSKRFVRTGLLFGNWQVLYGKNFFDTVDSIVSVWMLPIGGLMISIYVGWILSPAMLKEEFETGSKYGWMFRPWVFFIRWIAPIAIICIFLQQSGLINFDTLF